MRTVFGALSLLLVVLVIGLLVKKQLTSVASMPGVPANAAAPGAASAASGTPAQQSQQLQQHYKQAIEGAMQQARPSGDEVK